MKNFWHGVRVVVSVVTLISTVLGMVPWAPVFVVRAERSIVNPDENPSFVPIYLPVRLRPLPASQPSLPFSAPQAQSSDVMTPTVYLPLVFRNYVQPLSTEGLIYPGIGGVIGSPDGVVEITFTSIAVTETVRAHYTEVAPPSLPPSNLGVAGRAFSVTAETLAVGRPITYFPYEVKIITSTNPWYSVFTPSVMITMTYSPVDVDGLDLSQLAIYHHAGPDEGDWEKIPTAVYQDRNVMYMETDTIGRFVPMAPLAIYSQVRGNGVGLRTQKVLSDTGDYKRLVLDADDDVGYAYWPDHGEQREVAHSVRLIQAVRARLDRDKCRVEVLLTRESESPPFLDRAIRAQIARDFDPEIFATLTFNALKGRPWGWEGDGGTLIWSGGDSDDVALGGEFLNRLSVLGRPGKWGGAHWILPYSEFTGLSAAYAHVETLYLDHNYDWPIIRTGFDAIADAAYSAVRAQLEAQGMYCGDDPNNPPPYPAPPSAEMLQRWRDLGYQNYQRYGADPVSFSTGNHIVQARLTRIPGRGGLDWDFTLTYNSHDTRCDLFGCGWSFPYNARLQAYTDDSVTVALWDGRTYHYTFNGSGYDAPAGVFDRLEKVDEGWRWTTPNDVTLTFSETVGGFGILTEWRDRNGNALDFTYDLSGQDNWQDGEDVPRPPLTEIRNDAGRTVSVENDGEGRITRLNLWDGRTYAFEYDGEGNLTRIDGPDGQLRRFAYDDRHRMTREWDAEDILFLQSSYDDRDRVVEQVDASGTHSYLSYDVANRQTTFTDNLGNTEVYDWDELNRVTEEQDGSGAAVTSVYDGDYNLIARTDAKGNTTLYEYDDRGNLTARYDPIPLGVDYASDVSRWTYNGRNLVTSRTNALGYIWTYEYDSEGNLTRSVAPNGSDTTATYNEWGQPTSVTDALGRTTGYEYDNDGNLVKTTRSDGTFSTSTYDSSGRETSYTDANGHTVEFEYDAHGNITRIVDPKDAISLFEYDDNDLLVRSADRRGGERLYRYDENLKLTAERDAEGLWTRYGYDDLYRRVVITDTAGFATRYAYDEAGRLAAVIDPTGATTRYAHDDNGNTIAVTDALGNTTRMVYDVANRLKFTIDALGNRTEYCYDAEDQLVRTIGPRGEVTDYTYDALGRLIAVKDPLGNVTRYEHDAVGNRTAVVDPLEQRTDYAYNDLDRLVFIVRPELTGGERPTTQFGYDAVGNTTVITSPNGFAMTLAYDANDNVVTVTDPLGGQVEYVYDAEDTQISVTDPNGHAEVTTYNLVGLPIQVEDAMGFTATMEYDDAYNLTRRVNAVGEATTYEYDPLGRLLETTDPLGNATGYARDELGRVITATNANGHATQYDYDPVGNLISVADVLSGTTAYAYDEVGNLTVITDANRSVTRFQYNFLNQLMRETNPLDDSWWYSYDAAGHLTRRVDAIWQATYYDYDSNGRLAAIRYGTSPKTMHPVTFTYDLEGNETGMCDGLGCTAHTYDALGRPTTTTDWLGRTITRTYDAVGNLTILAYPNGYQVGYAYNANDWLTTFTDPHGASSVYQHNPLGQVTQIAHPNNTVTTLSHDEAGRLTGVDNRKQGAAQPQSAYAYAMDKVGNRVEVVETRAPFNGSGDPVELVHTYEYDALDRLVGAATNVPPSATDYTFDAVGNRLSKSGTVLAPDPGLPALPVAPQPEATTYTYNAANQLTEIEGTESQTALDYNANGDRVRETEVLTDGTALITDYVYDREDRLTGVTKSVSDTAALTVTTVATYTYDGYGRRALKEVAYSDELTATQVITYLYEGLDIIGAQLEQDGVVTETYYYLAPSPVTGMRRPLEMERLPNATTGFAGDRHWYQSDGLDSIVALTDESGDLASPFLYDEYGQLLAGTTELQLFAYTGQDYDTETRLYHFYARYYDPRTGSWTTRDSYWGLIVDPLSMHRYIYVQSNPIRWVDFLGFTLKEDVEETEKFLDLINKARNEAMVDLYKLSRIPFYKILYFNRYHNLVNKIRRYSVYKNVVEKHLDDLMVDLAREQGREGGISACNHWQDKKRIVESSSTYYGECRGAVTNHSRSISDAGLKFIAGFEGFRSKLYDCPAGHCTIGYGHLVHRGKCDGKEPPEFKEGISETRGLEILRMDVQRFENAVNKHVTVPLNQHQFDALVSFTFNLGEGSLQRSDLLRKLNEGDYDSVPSELLRWNKAGGAELSGLTRRRKAEGELFKNGVY